MSIATTPRSRRLRILAEGATVGRTYGAGQTVSTAGATLATVVQGATPAWKPVADVVVASDREVADLVARSDAKNADIWRRLADL